MKRTYGRFGFSFILAMFASVFVLYINLLQRVYRHLQWLLNHDRPISDKNIAITIFVAVTFTITLVYFIRRFIVRSHLVTINENEIIISPLHPFKNKRTMAIKDITKVDFIANKAKPELALTTQQGTTSALIAGNYVEIVNLSKAMIALGLPTEISGASAHYFKISSKELLQKAIIGYAVILAFYVILFVELYLLKHRHHH